MYHRFLSFPLLGVLVSRFGASRSISKLAGTSSDVRGARRYFAASISGLFGAFRNRPELCGARFQALRDFCGGGRRGRKVVIIAVVIVSVCSEAIFFSFA